MLFGLCVFYPINPVYANNNSVQQDKKEFDKKVDALTVDGIQSYFTDKLSKIKDEKTKATSAEEKDSIDKQIESYSITSTKVKNEINKDTLEKAKIKLKEYADPNYLTASASTTIDPIVYATVVATIVIGNDLGYIFSADMLNWSMSATTNSTLDIWNTNSIVPIRIKASLYYQQKLAALRTAYKNSGQVNGFNTEATFSYDGHQNIVEKDMYASIHALHYSTATVNNGYGELTLNDVYDFPAISPYDSFTTALNNLGSLAVDSGVCHVFNIKIHTVESFYDFIPVVNSFSYPNNAIVQGDFLYIRDANKNIIPGRQIDDGDNITVLDVNQGTVLIYAEYPTPTGVRSGYATNATSIIHYYYQGQYHNGSTSETVYDDLGNVIGSLDPWESCTPLYRDTTTGRLKVVYNTYAGVNTKSGFVVYNGGFSIF